MRNTLERRAKIPAVNETLKMVNRCLTLDANTTYPIRDIMLRLRESIPKASNRADSMPMIESHHSGPTARHQVTRFHVSQIYLDSITLRQDERGATSLSLAGPG